MSELTGSEKQIAWAEQIRTGWLAYAERQLTTTCRPERATKNPLIAKDRAAGVQAIGVVTAIRSAGFWIDHRSTFENTSHRIGVGAELILQQVSHEDQPPVSAGDDHV
jgi:hypothetical protein